MTQKAERRDQTFLSLEDPPDTVPLLYKSNFWVKPDRAGQRSFTFPGKKKNYQSSPILIIDIGASNVLQPISA